MALEDRGLSPLPVTAAWTCMEASREASFPTNMRRILLRSAYNHHDACAGGCRTRQLVTAKKQICLVSFNRRDDEQKEENAGFPETFAYSWSCRSPGGNWGLRCRAFHDGCRVSGVIGQRAKRASPSKEEGGSQLCAPPWGRHGDGMATSAQSGHLQDASTAL
jgi:hypothetical protein